MPSETYEDNKMVMLLRRFRRLNIDYKISDDGCTVPIYCSSSRVPRGVIVQILSDEKVDFHADDDENILVINAIAILGRDLASTHPVPKHLTEAARRIRYWKHMNEKVFRIHDCDIHNFELKTMSLREQILYLIQSAGFDCENEIDDIMAYKKIPPPCKLADAQKIVNWCKQSILPDYKLALFGSHLDGTSIEGISDVDMLVTNSTKSLDDIYLDVFLRVKSLGYDCRRQPHSIRLKHPIYGDIDFVPCDDETGTIVSTYFELI